MLLDQLIQLGWARTSDLRIVSPCRSDLFCRRLTSAMTFPPLMNLKVGMAEIAYRAASSLCRSTSTFYAHER